MLVTDDTENPTHPDIFILYKYKIAAILLWLVNGPIVSLQTATFHVEIV